MTEPSSKKPFLPPRPIIHLAWRIHRGLYRVTGGRFGLRRPRPDRYGLMRVTTIGRVSGQERSVMLAYITDGPNLHTMAMNGWDAPDPAWWLNLQAHPEAHIQLIDGPLDVVARAAEGEERSRLWQAWEEIDDNLAAFASLRPTETAVVVFEPVHAD